MDGKTYTIPPPRLSVSKKQICDTPISSKRVYQVWKGNNRFFLGGRLIFGPDASSLVFTIILIVAPVILFAVFVSRRLVNEFHHYLGSLIFGLPIVFMIYILCLLLLTSGRDPGIIPRSEHPPELEEDGDSSMLPADWPVSQASTSIIRPTKEVLVDKVIVRVKYCHTCMLYRSPRCTHCSVCDNCVERFDHHCPWVGQCIGKRNYRSFFMFVSSTFILCLYVFSFCWVNFKYIMDSYQCNIWRAFLKSPVSGVLILYTFVGVWFVGGLTAFHIYLICINQTTYEYYRLRYGGRFNPYNRGVFLNIKEILFSQIPPKNDFRAQVIVRSSTFTPLYSRRHELGPGMAKMVDTEMGLKRRPVDGKDLEEIKCQFRGDHRRSGEVSTIDIDRIKTEENHVIGVE